MGAVEIATFVAFAGLFVLLLRASLGSWGG